MILVAALIALFQLMYKEHWSYVWGAAKYGCVDCSGAFVYAYLKLAGITLPHGSNAIARRWTVGEMLPISEAKPGMAAFKAKEPGEDGYDLPDKYKEGGSSYNKDLRDYYHIGLVDNDPGYVLNAKGEKAGFCRDKLTEKNGWDFVIELKDVDYREDLPDMGEPAIVVLPKGAKGDTVNMRSGAGKNYQIVWEVPVGAKITVLDDQGQWCNIKYKNIQGWMMSNYIEYESENGESNDNVNLKKAFDQIDVIQAALDELTLALGGRG